MKSILTCFCFLLAIIAVNSQGIINNVSFEFNDSWKKQYDPEVLDSAVSVGYRYLGDSIYSFRVDALIRVNNVPRTISVEHIQIDYFAQAIKMNRIITAREGNNWKSSIFLATEEETQHIAFHRIGVHNGVVLELMLFFENKGDDGSVKALTVNERNAEGQMTGLVISESLGNEMLSIYKEVAKTLKIFGEEEESFSLTLIDPPTNSTIYRQSKN